MSAVNSGSEDEEELATARFDICVDGQIGAKAGDAIDQPCRSSLAVLTGGTSSHHLAAAFALQAVDARENWGRVGDEEVGAPRDHRGDRALFGVAPAMGEPLVSLALAPGRQAVDARAAWVVDRHLRIDRLVTQPAAPAVRRAHLVETAHRLPYINEPGVVGWVISTLDPADRSPAVRISNIFSIAASRLVFAIAGPDDICQGQVRGSDAEVDAQHDERPDGYGEDGR